MPGRNRMGPAGRGPMTGRGAGYCAGSGAQRFMSPGPGVGGGGGRGWGAPGGWGGGGRRRWFQATGLPGCMRAWAGSPGQTEAEAPSPAGERLAALQQEAAGLEEALGDLKVRIRELEERESSAAGRKGEP